MADSDITLSGLVATPGVGHIALQYVVDDPHAAGLLNLSLDVVEVHAAATNNRNAATKVADGNMSGGLHVAIVEGATYYYWVRAKNQLGYYGDWYPSGATSGVVGTVGYASGNALVGGKITATPDSPSANKLTIAIKTLSGADPSAENPAWVPFRDTSGSYASIAIVAATSLVISNGSTFDTGNNVPFKLHVCGLSSSGAFSLGVIKCVDANRTFVYPLNEEQLYVATAEGGAGAADTAGVMYATAAIASPAAFRRLAILEWASGLATAGNYNVAPTVKLVGPGVKAPGDTAQEFPAGNSTTVASNTTTMAYGSGLPANSEGSAVGFWDVTITPTSKANLLLYHTEISVSHHTGSCHVVAGVFQDGTTALVADAVKINAADDIGKIVISRTLNPDSLSARTYGFRVGGSAAGTWTVNGVNNASKLGGLATFASVRELVT